MNSSISQTGLEVYHQIALTVCKALGVTDEELKSNLKQQFAAEARQIIFKILRDKGLKFKAIGKLFNRDHSTVMYNIDMYNDKVQCKDKQFLAKVAIVKSKLEGICELT